MFSIILSCISLALAIFALGLMRRNQWVFDRRAELNRFENGIHLIHQYVDYDEMMRKFWIWDIEKLKKQVAPNE